MKDRKEMSEQFRQKRDDNRADNKSRAHGVRVGGTYYEHGIPNPGSLRKLSIGGVTTVYFGRR